MSNRILFYAPATNDYISPTSLWSVARITENDDGVHWLETQWVGSGDIQGMALYTSVLDAAIAVEVLNQEESPTEWQVYPFSDINITEMMINTKAARKAVSTAHVTKTPMFSAESQYCVSTYSTDKQMWIVSSLTVNGSKPANKLH